MSLTIAPQLTNVTSRPSRTTKAMSRGNASPLSFTSPLKSMSAYMYFIINKTIKCTPSRLHGSVAFIKNNMPIAIGRSAPRSSAP